MSGAVRPGRLATTALAATLALAGVPGARATGEGFEVEPRELAWSELAERAFDPRWRLPPRRTSGTDLRAAMVELAALRFEVADADGTTLRSFGDLARAAGPLGADERRAWLDDLLRRAPEALAGEQATLRELLLDDQLFDRRWNPDDDLPRDGFVHADAWDLAELGAPWNDLGVTPLAEQGACFVRTDAATWKAVESDYRRYFDHVGVAYESLHPKRGTHYRGTDPDGLPFWTYRLHARCDLPFPFGDYKMDVHVLNHAEGGRLVCDVYSTSEDFHWLAGQDVFVPVAASDGAPVGLLVVRVYGFDLDGVPDKPAHRRAALRSALGNLRRAVERVERDPDSPRPGDAPLVPEARLWGR